jgi:starch synthase
VVRQTGGLKDTVQEFDPRTGEGTGFTFIEPRSEDLLSAVKKSLSVYKDKPLWTSLVKSDMALDYSWKSSAKEYINLFNRIIKKRCV